MATKRFRIYSAHDVAEHSSSSSCWVARDGKVYDISAFLNDHPGGDDIILQYAGKDVGVTMKDPSIHEHSEAAYGMLDEYVIGRLGTSDTIVDENWNEDDVDNFHPEETDVEKDLIKNQFLDLHKPLLRQVWEGNFSKSYYLSQVHQPRHLPGSARLFGPGYLEVFTVTPWYVVPMIWLPIAGYIFLRSLFGFTFPLQPFFTNPTLPIWDIMSVPLSSWAKTGACFLLGNFIWTFLEYLIHRFVFHLDALLPDMQVAILLHFTMHGVHHYLPMDKLRLVMPPILFTTLQAPFTRLAHIVFPPAIANGIISGAFAFYVMYDCTHYALHHTNLPAYWKELKKYHLAHHYKNFELGFGVTSWFWDEVFGTYLVT